jgi:outer membrane lipoprotein-sorting protein
MIVLPLALILQQEQPSQAALEKMTAFIRDAHTLSAEMTLTCPAIPQQGTARMVYVKPNKLFFSIKWAKIDYEFVGNDKGSWDADPSARIYDETTDWHWYYPDSLFSDAPMYFTPGYLMDGTLHTEQIGKLVVGGTSTVNGVNAFKIQGAPGSRQGEIYVDANGKPLRSVYYRKFGAITADIKSLIVNQPVPSSLFGYNPPLGFSAYSVPLTPSPIGVGKKFPIEGWSGSGSLAKIAAGKSTLVIVTDAGCEPSSRSASTLAHIKAKIPVAVVTLSTSGAVPSSLSAFPKFYDPSGKLGAAVNAPATPIFYLINSTGFVQKMWLGFDPDHAADFQADVLKTAS